MYNRYIPQPDGSYARRQYQDTPPPPPRQQNRPQQQERWQPEPETRPHQTEAAPQLSQGPASQSRHRRTNPYRQRPNRPTPPPPKPEPRESRQNTNPKNQETSVLGFLKQLLPKDFDTGDLLIVLLLLLMSGDCQEDQNTALLTLVMYLFM